MIKAFRMILEGEDEKIRTLYQGLSKQPVTYQHVEEFLIASGKKKPVSISAKEVGKEYYEVKESARESFYIQREQLGTFASGNWRLQEIFWRSPARL